MIFREDSFFFSHAKSPKKLCRSNEGSLFRIIGRLIPNLSSHYLGHTFRVSICGTRKNSEGWISENGRNRIREFTECSPTG